MPPHWRKAGRPENDLQREVVAHLRRRGTPGVFYFHPPNHHHAADYLIAMGMVVGIHDLILIKQGKAYGLELKVRHRGSVVSDAQHDVHRRFEAAGGISGIARDLEQALAFLETHELILPEARACPSTSNPPSAGRTSRSAS